MKKKTYIILLILLATVTVVLLLGGLQKEKVMRNNLEEIAVIYNTEQNERQERIKFIEQSIYEDIPGIIVWGDSLTVGSGGEGTTYPKVLEKLINSNIYNIPVINMGVGGETSSTILGRSGAVPFVVDAFTLPKDTSKVKIKIKSLNGSEVAPLRQGDKGVNPVTISGISGIISIEQNSPISPSFSYYFNRIEPGDSVNIEEGTIMATAAAISTEYQNYIPIVYMGVNGGWNDPQDLISQIESILNMDKSNTKHIVLGITTGTTENRQDLEMNMEAKFGERYINLRKYFVDNGIEILGSKATIEDKNAIKEGSIPPSLLYDSAHFTSLGYTIIGQLIYERMIQLGYFENILKLIDEINAL